MATQAPISSISALEGPLSHHVISQAFSISDFVATGHRHGDIVDETTRRVIYLVTNKNLRPTTNRLPTSLRERRARSRSASVDAEQQPPSAWPSDWAIDLPLFRRVVKAFVEDTLQLHELARPASTGNTPATTSPSASPRLTPTTSSSPGPTTRNTSVSVDEVITPRLQEPSAAASMAGTFTQAQADQMAAIIGQALAISRQQQGPEGNGSPNSNGNANGGNAPTAAKPTHFNPKLVGYFDPNPDKPAVEVKDGTNTYHNVFSFTARLKVKETSMDKAYLCQNLDACLLDKADSWYTNELSPASRLGMRFDPDGVGTWCASLEERFRDAPGKSLATLETVRYTVADARMRHDPADYMSTIVLNGKNSGIATSEASQVLLAYEHIDGQLRRDLTRPTPTSTVASMIQELRLQKDIWFDIYSSSSMSSARSGKASQQQPARQPRFDNRPQGQYGQYQSNRAGYQPFRQGYQSYGNARPYYQNNPAYQTNQQSNQGLNQRPQLPANPQRLQITAPTGANVSGSRFDNKQTQQGPSSEQPRFPFKPKSYEQRWRQQRPQQAYQASASASSSEHLDEQGQPATTSHDDSSYESFPQVYDDEFEPSQEAPVEGFDEPDDDYYADGCFSAIPIMSPDHQCDRCHERFTSKNKLFLHLRDKCWKSPKPDTLRKPAADTPATQPSADTVKPVTDAKDVTIISSSAPPVQGTGYAFKNYHYAITQLQWSPEGDAYDICADPGCTMSIIDAAFVPNGTEIRTMPTSIPIRGIGSKIHQSDQFALFTFYLKGTLPEGRTAMAQITREVHIVKDLKAKMLMGADIVTPESMVLDFAEQRITIGSCQNLIVPMSTRIRSAPVKRVIKNKAQLTIPAKSTTSMPVVFNGSLPDDRDLLFEPDCQIDLGQAGGVFAHIVDASLGSVHVRNDTDVDVVVPRKARLGTVEEFNYDGCYMVDPCKASLAACGWRNKGWKGKLAMAGLAAAAALSVTVARGSLSETSTPNKDLDTLPKPSTCVKPVADATIDPLLEHVMPNGVTIYGKPHAAEPLSDVIDEFSDLFVDKGETVDIPEDQWMPIPLKPNAKSKPARVYPVGQRDKDVIDDTFDKLQAQGKLTWSNQPTPFSYPVFIVWRDTPAGRKGRVIVDIRELNKLTENDTYPLPLQAKVIALVQGHRYITTVDAVGWFHQFKVKVRDRHKLTVISHRGQEQSSVALMGYKGSPPYVQRQTDAMLRPFKDFAKAYVDDIIIFSYTLEEHLKHLRQIFQLFRRMRVSLSPTKSFIGYPSVTLLGQRVDGLGMSTTNEKVAAITSLRFPENLRDLEIFLGLTGWLRSSIPRYAQRTDPLQKRKTLLTKGLATGVKGPARKRTARAFMYEPTQAEHDAFKDLQEAFSSPRFLIHYDRHRTLYIDLDASKVVGFAAMVYHVKKDSTRAVPRTDVEPIMFFSRGLNDAEKNYWPTELEVAGVVWVVKKVRHMIESNLKPPVVIYTDHSAAVPISRQTSLTTASTDKLNLRLVRASQYLSSFNLELRHKAGKSNTVPDALSRLPTTQHDKDKGSEGILDVLYGTPVAGAFRRPPIKGLDNDGPMAYHTTLVDMTDDFKLRLRQAYESDEHWRKIRDMLQPSADGGNDEAQADDGNNGAQAEAPQTEEHTQPGLPFVKRDDLLYHVNGAGVHRLCVPSSMEKELFEQAHDMSSHGGYHRCHDRLSHSLYIRHLSKRLRQYIAHCPQCQVSQTKRHLPYGSLVPIAAPSIPFHTIAMDFIVALPTTLTGMNTLLTVTCKATKRVLLVPGLDTWTAPEWAEVVLRALLDHDWGIPRSIISDRDSRFMSDFWQRIFALLGVKFLTATAYHPQTDGQSERTNQTVEIAMRFHLTSHPDKWNEWHLILPYIQATLNNSPSSTGFAPNELCYGFKVNNTMDMLSDLPAEDFSKLRLAMREEAEDSMAFATAMMKVRYDSKHRQITFKKDDKVFLRLHHGYSIPGLNRKLSQQRAGPFKVLAKVGHHAYRLELPPTMRIHPVISVAQLEPAHGEDPYGRVVNEEPPPITDEDGAIYDDEYVIERLLNKEVTDAGRTKYLVKWRGWGAQHNVWYDLEDLEHAGDLVKAYEDNQPPPRPVRNRRRQDNQTPPRPAEENQTPPRPVRNRRPPARLQ